MLSRIKSKFAAAGLSKLKIVLPAISVLFVLLAVGFYVFYLGEKEFVPVQAGAGQNVQGWIWSENIGWISLNSSNCDPDNDGQSNGATGCPSTGSAVPNYGVSIYRPSNWSDAEAGKFSGWAWSENIGWVTFDRATAGNPPTAPFLNATNTIMAALDDDSNAVRGWARAVSACKDNYWNGSACTSTSAGSASGGWDGWIKLGPSTMGVDATPPVISSVVAINITATSATATWSTDEISTSQVEYGLTVSYGSQTILDATLLTSHSVNLTGLTSNTLYHFRVKSKDAANNEAISGDYTFTTLEIPGSLNWTQTSNPLNSANTERAQAIAVDSTGIYVAGSDKSAGAGRWRVEKRNVSDGSIAWTITSDPHSTCNDISYAIAVDSTGIYVAGQANAAGACGYYRWRVEKRSLTDGSLITSFGTNGIVDGVASGSDARSATAIAVDSTGIYVAGYDAVPGNYQWRIEKLNPTNGSSIWVQTSNPSSQTAEYAYAIVVDSTGFYVAGSDLSLGSSNAQWRVEKRNLTDGNLITSFGTNGVATSNPSSSSDVSYTITVDSTGFYVAGYDSSPGNYQWRVEKRSLTDGSQIWVQTSNPSSQNDLAYAIAVDSTGIYVAGSDRTVGSSNLQWRVEKRSLITGVLIYGVTSNPSSTNDEALAITVDSSAIYAAGYDNVPGNEQWRIEKRAKGMADTSAPLISGVAAKNITFDSAAIVWNTDETANSQVDYGLTTSYGTTFSYTSTYGTFHVSILNGLSPNTTYNFRVKSKDPNNNEATSGNYTFTTSATTLGTIGDRLGTNGVYAWSEGSIYGVSTTPVACKKGTTYAGTAGDPYPSVTNINAGRAHSLAIKTTGKVEAWGSNSWGKLGTGAGGAAYTSISTLMSNTIALAAGYDNSLAVKSDGTVWAWGANSAGQLGIGTSDNNTHITPVQVLGPGGVGYLTGATAVAVSYFSSAASYSNATSFALKSDGTVWVWGYGYSTTPVQLSQGVLSDIVAISAKTSGLTLALKSDGTVWTWGTYPVQVQDSSGTGYLNDVIAISASGNHSLALKSDGTVWAWGTNTYGQLGDGTTTARTLPVQVSGLSSVKAISAGFVSYFHSLALKSDGTVWAWGQNNYGQLGNGTTDSSAHSTPAQVPGLSGISVIAAGDANSFALEQSGNVVWAWGFNNNGEANYSGGPLGDGTTINRSSPVQVSGIYSGVSWTDIPCPANTKHLFKTMAPQPGLLAFVNAGGSSALVYLYRSTDDGQNWTLEHTGGDQVNIPQRNIITQVGDQIYAYCGKNPSGYNQICRSSDDGQTWTQSVTPITGSFCSLYAHTNVVLVGTCFGSGGPVGKITLSADFGSTWPEVYWMGSNSQSEVGNMYGFEYVESGAGDVISPTFGYIAFDGSTRKIWKRVTRYTYPTCTNTSTGTNRLSKGAAGCPPAAAQLCGTYSTDANCEFMVAWKDIAATFPFTATFGSMSVFYGNDIPAPSPTDILYAVVQDSVSPYIAKVIKSTDYGSTWTLHFDTGVAGQQPGRIAKLLNEAKLLFTLYNNSVYKISP